MPRSQVRSLLTVPRSQVHSLHSCAALTGALSPYGVNFPTFPPLFNMGTMFNAIERVMGNDGPQQGSRPVMKALIKEMATKPYHAFFLNGDISCEYAGCCILMGI